MQSWFKRRLHSSWLIAWFCLAAVGGIALCTLFGSAMHEMWWCVIATTAFCAALIKPRIINIILAVIAGLLIGLWRGGTEQNGLAGYKAFYGKEVTIQGTVSEDTAYGPHGDQRVLLGGINIQGHTLNGQVWVSIDTEAALRRSDNVTVQGKLGDGFGSITASMFRARVSRITHPQPGNIGLTVRDWFGRAIRLAIPEPEASLASGYLIGQRSALPVDLDGQLKTVGLTHAVVASGYNLTILVSAARQLFSGISKYLAALVSASLIAGFVMISGLSPSMSRASLVTGLSLAAWYYGRRVHPLVLLPFAAAITAMINPLYVWGDIGWYLSFTSFAGVIIIAPLVQRALWRSTERPGFVMQIVVDTMSAQLATLPIMLFAFGHYSPYALLANLLVLPLVPLTMLLTFIAGTGALLIPSLAQIVGLPATLILRYMTSVIGYIADLPGAQGTLAIGPIVVAASYGLLAAAVITLWRHTRFDFRAEEIGEPAKLS